MKLECTLRRVGGTDVDLPPHTIQFRPLDPSRADSPHVADVEPEIAARLMAADHRVYRPFEAAAARARMPAPTPATPTPAAPKQQEVLYGSNTLPAQIDLGGGQVATLGDVVAQAFKASGLTVDQWNELDEEARDARLNALIDAARGIDPGATPKNPPATATGDKKGDPLKSPDANGDGLLSVRELKAALKAGTLDHDALRDLMAKEEARGAEARDSFIAEIVKALR